MNKIIFLPFAAAILLMVSCSESSLPNKQSSELTSSYLDLKNAEYVAHTSGSNDWSNLYKLTQEADNYQMELVGFLDENGNKLDSTFSAIQVNEIISITEDYNVLIGNFQVNITNEDAETYWSILVRLSDGAVFDFGYNPQPANNFKNENYLPVDKTGERYFSNFTDVYKLGGLEEGQPTIETVIDNSTWEIPSFFVTHEGGIIFYDTQNQNTKIRKTDGSYLSNDYAMFNFFYNSNNELNAWSPLGLLNLDVDSDTLLFSRILSEGFLNPVEFFYQTNDAYIFVDEGGFGYVYTEADTGIYPVYIQNSVNFRPVEVNNNYLWTRTDGSINVGFKRYNLENYSIEDIFVDVFKIITDTTFRTIQVERDGVFVDSVVTEISFRDTLVTEFFDEVASFNEENELSFPSNYEIYNYRISDEGVLFSGFDLNIGRNVLGILRENNQVLILQEFENEKKIETLEQIN